MRHRDLANKLALWAWGKVIPNEITELEKFILRGLEEVSAQQPEDEIYDSLNKLAMDMKNASSGPCGQDSLTLGKRSNTKMWLKKILIIITRFEAILAKRKEAK